MFWYKKSNTKHGKIKSHDIQILVKSFYLWRESPSMNLWQGTFAWWDLYWYFQKVVPSLTTFSFMTQTRHSLCWLHCFARPHIKIHHSVVTTLAMLIYMKTSFITDYSYYTDIHDNMKNSFITESADYLVFNTRG